MKPGVDIVWFELEPHFYWMTSHMQGARIGETTYAWDSDGKEYQAIFDSGSSVLMVPENLYSPLLRHIFWNTKKHVSRS